MGNLDFVVKWQSGTNMADYRWRAEKARWREHLHYGIESSQSAGFRWNEEIERNFKAKP
jgi:hypothetical protein